MTEKISSKSVQSFLRDASANGQRKVQKIIFSRFRSLRAVPGSLIYFFLFDVRAQPFYCFIICIDYSVLKVHEDDESYADTLQR